MVSHGTEIISRLLTTHRVSTVCSEWRSYPNSTKGRAPKAPCYGSRSCTLYLADWKPYFAQGLAQFTAVAYQQRTSYPCSELSFSAIAEGSLPSISIDVEEDSASDFHFLEGDHENTTDANVSEPRCMIEMVICSFALHLVENPSDLFSLLWQLSLKARWLVVLTPHKKPEV